MKLDLSDLYCGTRPARLADLPAYESMVRRATTPGGEIILTGHAPIWLYLRIAHLLHGIAKRLLYYSPVSGTVEIFNHNPE